MKMLQMALLFTFIGGMINCMDENTNDKNITSPSVFRTTAKAAAVYAGGTLGFGTVGALLSRYSGLSGAHIYDVCDKAMKHADANIVKLVDPEKQFYSPSIPKHYAAKFAHKAYVVSSVFSAPLRSIWSCVTDPIWYANEIIGRSHELKNPKCDYSDSKRAWLQSIKQDAKTTLRKTWRYAFLGFGTPFAVQKLQKYSDVTSLDSLFNKQA